MREGQAVTWENGGERHYGVITTDPFSCCGNSEEPVHPFNEGYSGLFSGMESSSLQSITDSDVPAEFQLTQEHTQEVCKFGQGKETCKFLVVSSSGFQCAKGSCVNLMFTIEFKSNMIAKGDNCRGRIGAAPVSEPQTS